MLNNNIAKIEKSLSITSDKTNKILAYYKKSLPKNKDEINNFAKSNMSFGDWLEKYNTMFDKRDTSGTAGGTLAIIFGTIGGIFVLVATLLLIFRKRIKKQLAIRRERKQKDIVRDGSDK